MVVVVVWGLVGEWCELWRGVGVCFGWCVG